MQLIGTPDASRAETDTPEHAQLEARMRRRDRREAAANLAALPRPAKPPVRRSEG